MGGYKSIHKTPYTDAILSKKERGETHTNSNHQETMVYLNNIHVKFHRTFNILIFKVYNRI